VPTCHHPIVSHRRAEERSLALHRVVAARIRTDPAVLERARDRVRGWRDGALVAPFYRDAWASLLAMPVDELCTTLVRDDESMAALRQVTPFAGALAARERWLTLAAHGREE
jgi:hypothetical protein